LKFGSDEILGFDVFENILLVFLNILRVVDHYLLVLRESCQILALQNLALNNGTFMLLAWEVISVPN
jgi:hypothetical protein